jgi:hypothetical protein
LHTVDCLVFEQELVVFRDGNKEENGGNIFEAVDPLLPFGSLATDVEHTVGQIANDEGGLSDTGSLDTRPKNVLIIWYVVGRGDTFDGVEVATEVISVEETYNRG